MHRRFGDQDALAVFGGMGRRGIGGGSHGQRRLVLSLYERSYIESP